MSNHFTTALIVSSCYLFHGNIVFCNNILSITLSRFNWNHSIFLSMTIVYELQLPFSLLIENFSWSYLSLDGHKSPIFFITQLPLQINIFCVGCLIELRLKEQNMFFHARQLNLEQISPQLIRSLPCFPRFERSSMLYKSTYIYEIGFFLIISLDLR